MTLFEQQARTFCQQKINELQLAMKLANVFKEESQLVFEFASEGRVDFRNLVKILAQQFKTRIELRQVGVRDVAKALGGIGVCGRGTCCSTFLSEFKPVSIRMAKDQNLALNQDKLSGLCGRLRCCLQYEQALYQEAQKQLPKVGKRVLTPQGDGRVKDINVLKKQVRVQLTQGGSAEFAVSEIQPFVAA